MIAADGDRGASRDLRAGCAGGPDRADHGRRDGPWRARRPELARCGAAVTIAGRRQEVLEEAAAGPRGRTGRLDWVAATFATPRTRAVICTVAEQDGHLDVLVNNAGGQFFSPAELIAAKGWRAVWRLNVEGMLNMSERRTSSLRPAGAGTVINVTLSPHHGMPGMAHSGAARATVEALTRELALRWASTGITVTAVAAGHFATEVTAKYPAGVRAGASRSVPIQRLGTPSSTPGWSPCSPPRWAEPSTARPSRSTARGTTGTAPGRRRACGRRRRGAGRGAQTCGNREPLA